MSTATQPGPRLRTRFVLFVLIAAGGCLADLASKAWAFATLGEPSGPTRWIWQDVIGLQTALNPGALFGMGGGLSWLFALLSLVAAVSLLYWFFVGRAARDAWLTVTLALILAGILGNLYDRLGFSSHPDRDPALQYAVRDWILVRIHVGRWSYDWPNFNLADSMLVCGAGMVVWHALVRDGVSRRRETAATLQSGTAAPP
jgi:signal peptidase II